jgi:hypothetical protein
VRNSYKILAGSPKEGSTRETQKQEERWSRILRHQSEKVWSEMNWWDIVDMVAKFRVPYKGGI